MEALLKPCQQCHKPMNGGVYRASHICPHCLFEHEGGKSRRKKASLSAVSTSGKSSVDEDPAQNRKPAAQKTPEKPPATQVAPSPSVDVESTDDAATSVDTTSPGPKEQSDQPDDVAVEATGNDPESVVLTSKSVDENSLELFIGEISAECVLNIKITPDLIQNGKFVGNKSEKVKAALVQGKKHALNQLRQKAQKQGANLVSDVAVKNVVKSADAQKVSLVVKATGAAAKIEVTEVIC